MTNILSEQCQYLDQRNIAMCCYVLGKRNIQDDNVWSAIQKYVENGLREFTWKNLMLVIYSFSRMDKADTNVWELFEDAVVFQIQRREMKQNEQVGSVGVVLPGRDISQILWSFASLKKGSLTFWQEMESVLSSNAHNFDFKTFNKCLFSFYFAEKGSDEFWIFISQMRLNIPQKQADSNVLDDILFLSRIFQSKMDEKVAQFNFNPLLQKFITVFKNESTTEQVILESKARLCYHQILIEKDVNLQSKEIIDIYLKKLKKSSEVDDQKDQLQLYIDFTYMIFTLNLQDKYLDFQIQANRILIRKIVSTQAISSSSSSTSTSSSSSQRNENNQQKISDQKKKYYSKVYSGMAWVLYLNINECKSMSFEHKLELLDFLFNNFIIFLETDKKFCLMIQKILSPIANDQRVFEFFMQKLTSNRVYNPLQHFYLIFLISLKNQCRLDTYNLKNLLFTQRDSNLFDEEYHNIISRYRDMYNDPLKFDIKQLLEMVLSHFILPTQKVEDIVTYQQDSSNKSSSTSNILQIKKHATSSLKEFDSQQIISLMNQNLNQEEKI